ncbi:hypothetical protein VTI74DRAFT_2642 [Chaetomium olivicolor]
MQQRIDHLGRILRQSQFPPERANIEAAIAGYESGAIPYSDSYTLIWSGRIVDTCADYDSFTTNRSTRLDRYAAEYGPGWLWYEPPLSGREGTIRGPSIQINKALCLDNKADWRRESDNAGHYRIQMGFRRRKHLVARDNKSQSYSHKPNIQSRMPHLPISGRITSAPPPKPEYFEVASSSTRDPDGPRVFWETLLDSGATFPCLFGPDVQLLGINPKTYAAQSSRTVCTADGTIDSVIYELDVGVYDGRGGTLLTHNPDRPRFSRRSDEEQEGEDGGDDDDDDGNDRRTLGCTTPVVILRGSAPDIMPANSRVAPDRLSGMLPFQVCYATSAPGQFKLWLGERRCEVLGADRFPGHVRWGEIKGALRDDDCDDDKGEKRIWSARMKKHRLMEARKIVFEHDFADGSGRMLREEESIKMGHVIQVVGSEMSKLGDGLVTEPPRKGYAAQRVPQQRRSNGVKNRVRKATM